MKGLGDLRPPSVGSRIGRSCPSVTRRVPLHAIDSSSGTLCLIEGSHFGPEREYLRRFGHGREGSLVVFDSRFSSIRHDCTLGRWIPEEATNEPVRIRFGDPQSDVPFLLAYQMPAAAGTTTP